MKVRAGPSGLHLFDRNTGTNILLDEVTPPSQFWARAPRQVSIALTNACDLSCPHCFAPKVAAALDLETLQRWLTELDENGALGVGFGGGEPTLYPKFVELCRFAARRTALAVTFTTHGHHLSKMTCDALIGLVHFVRVSMDGVGATYEELRGRSFAELTDSLRRVSKLSSFGINFVVNERTLEDLDAAIAIAANVGASEFLLLPQQATAGVGAINPGTLDSLRSWVDAYRGSVRLAISGGAASGFPIGDPMSLDASYDEFAHIDAKGVLKASSFQTDGIKIGPSGVLEALAQLRQQENAREDLVRLRI